MNFNIKHQQLGTQCDSNVNSQIPDFTPIGDLIFSPNRQNIKCITSMTFDQKLYQSQAEEIKIAEEFELALEANSLSKINKLLENVLELNSFRRKLRQCSKYFNNVT